MTRRLLGPAAVLSMVLLPAAIALWGISYHRSLSLQLSHVDSASKSIAGTILAASSNPAGWC